MDFRFRPQDEAFRQELRNFLAKELPPDWAGSTGELQPEEFEFDIHMRKRFAAMGWLALAWPERYGGGGADVLRQALFREETSYHRSPGTDNQGIGLIGPCIMVHGTEEQKKEHLGRIAGGEAVWCQGFSEPGSGSDLAGLQTRAVRDGDDYVINGQKIWTSYAHRSDWIHVLTRTDPEAPKHRGISYFLVDMKSAGIQTRPLINMANGHGFNEVFFDDVRVPAANMLGGENQGWYVATTTLDFERSGIGVPAALLRLLEEAADYLRSEAANGGADRTLPLARHKLADLAVAVQTARLLAYRVAWMQNEGLVPNREASQAKLFGSELNQRTARTILEILGLRGQLEPGEHRAALAGRIEKLYLYSLGSTIAAGTSEIQRNIIATRGLGLPR